MALKSKPVPMPEKKVTFKTAANGTKYAYYTLRAYRDKNGKPTSDEVSIGKKCPDTGMLIPNLNYFGLFGGPAAGAQAGGSGAKHLLPDHVASYGSPFSLMGAAQAPGLPGILEECFPDNWQQLLAAAFYMLCEGNVMSYVDNWFDETDVFFAERMDDRQCSQMFAAISYPERMGFFRRWLNYRCERE
jgi:hypothetical protein